jgi:hypothetical protein
MMSKNLQKIFFSTSFILSPCLYASSQSLEENLAYCGSIQTFTSQGIAIASGTLVGLYAPEGDMGPKKGIGLTTAHTFLDKDLLPLNFKSSSFSTSHTIVIGGTGADIESISMPTGVGMENGQGINDICLFTTGYLAAPMTIKTLPLYTGQGYKAKPNLEGMILGYGSMYKAGATHETEYDLARHKGYTSTTFYSAETDFRNRPVFRTFLKGSLTKAEILQEGFLNGFSNAAGDDAKLHMKTGYLFVKAHKNQSSPGSGCSGGPLVFNTSIGPRLAGVFSQTSLETLGMSLFDKKPLVTHTFEAVPAHPWLHECVEQFCATGNIAPRKDLTVRRLRD